MRAAVAHERQRFGRNCYVAHKMVPGHQIASMQPRYQGGVRRIYRGNLIIIPLSGPTESRRHGFSFDNIPSRAGYKRPTVGAAVVGALLLI